GDGITVAAHDAFVAMEHARRRMPHCHVTENPMASWTLQEPGAAIPSNHMRGFNQELRATFGPWYTCLILTRETGRNHGLPERSHFFPVFTNSRPKPALPPEREFRGPASVPF